MRCGTLPAWRADSGRSPTRGDKASSGERHFAAFCEICLFVRCPSQQANAKRTDSAITLQPLRSRIRNNSLLVASIGNWCSPIRVVVTSAHFDYFAPSDFPEIKTEGCAG